MKTDTASDAMPCRIWISREQKTFYFKEKKGFGKKEFASEAHMWAFRHDAGQKRICGRLSLRSSAPSGEQAERFGVIAHREHVEQVHVAALISFGHDVA